MKRIIGSVDSTAYQAILDDALPRIYTSRYIWQHDGAPCHTSRSTSEYLQQKAIRMIVDWPPQSADLSPIENLWDFLKEKVANRKSQNVEEIWRYTEEEFYQIPNDYISKLYQSLPKRVEAIIKAKGFNTKY